MKTNPKIALIVTSEGLECVTLIAKDEQSRAIALDLAQMLKEEITLFDEAVKLKLTLLMKN